ncbi:MAG: hypothetical protein Q4B08_12730 [Propionibacteriaceae bacterium]|nr:hypothetical protein [Propionibacteriaceae bacterium]
MAETRKFQTSATGIAAAVRAAIGDEVRPIAPGEPTPEGDGSPAAAERPTVVSMPFLSAGAAAFLRPADPDGEDPA